MTRRWMVAALISWVQVLPAMAATVNESERDIPVMESVDVVVVGGTSAGVAAAEAAARAGASVYLVAPRPYLGEDLCATLRLEIDKGRTLETDLEQKLFGKSRETTPGYVKATLSRALLDADVEFMLASYVTDVLRDGEGHPCGVVIGNRSGRQAIVAKVIIDATHHAWACRLAGCESDPWPGGEIMFERTVLVPGAMKKRTPAKGKRRRRSSRGSSVSNRVYQLGISMKDMSFASLAAADQVARDRTSSDSVLRGAESLFCVPPNPILCKKGQEEFKGGGSIGLDHLRPKNAQRLYVLSGCADVPRDKARELLCPAGMTRLGAEVGSAAAREAKHLTKPKGVRVLGKAMKGGAKGDVRELLSASGRAADGELKIPSGARGLPVLASVDVLVVGGGTSGAPAGIAAARMGARTLVVEYQEGLGGMGTLGMIGKPYHGRRIGFAKSVPWPKNIEPKMEWYRSELRKAGGDVWFGVLGCGAFVDGNAVKGAAVCTPQGRGVILAKLVIDGTGNGDVAIAAGADYMYGAIERGDIALQGTGLPARGVTGAYANSDYLLVDESDLMDVWRALVSVQLRHGKGFDSGTLIQTRERRRVTGDHVMRYIDQIAGRTYPDSIVFSGSDYDSHGYPSSPFFSLLPHDAKSRKANHPAPGGTCYTPYRCLLPKGLDGILVTGLGISMDRDATAMVRMQLDMANQGYAAGYAAAMVAGEDKSPRRLDVRKLQKHLVATGALPQNVLTHKDSFPVSVETVRRAVADYGKATNPKSAGKALAVILTHRETALPLLQKACEASDGEAKLLYAQVLGVFGDKSIVPILTGALAKVEKWDAKILQGRMADHAHLPTPIDGIITALGYAGDRAAVPAILRVARTLDSRVTLSHHRSVAMALERLGDPAAAPVLADILGKPKMQGYAMASLPVTGKAESRTESIREITLARALYRCGDHRDLGKKILKEYRRDLRGLFARHARAVLGEQGVQE